MDARFKGEIGELKSKVQEIDGKIEKTGKEKHNLEEKK
jgi:hypothetical protein